MKIANLQYIKISFKSSQNIYKTKDIISFDKTTSDTFSSLEKQEKIKNKKCKAKHKKQKQELKAINMIGLYKQNLGLDEIAKKMNITKDTAIQYLKFYLLNNNNKEIYNENIDTTDIKKCLYEMTNKRKTKLKNRSAAIIKLREKNTQ